MDDALTGGQYEIVIGGLLDEAGSNWFSDFDLQPDGNNTVLTGAVADQPALHGVLARLRDLGLPILKVQRMSEDLD